MTTPPSSIYSQPCPLPSLSTTNLRKRRQHPTTSNFMISSPRSTMSSIAPPSPAASATGSGSSFIAVGSSDEEAIYAAAGVPKYLRRRGDREEGLEGPDSDDEAVRSEKGDDDRIAFELEDYCESISSALKNHIFEGGLRYHAYRDGKYAFPNDDIEQNRDDMKHTLTLMLCKRKHFLTPIDDILEKGATILDLGTGTGIWCTEMGELYPKAIFHGNDLSPIQPNMVPDNVYFVVDDFEDEWVWPENKFDYIHMRHTVHSVKDRTALFKKIFKHLKPGGYVEFQEMQYAAHCDDNSCTPESPYAFRDFLSYLDLGMRNLGADLNAILKVPHELQAIGFTELRTVVRKCPIGVWPKDRDLRYVGLFMRTVIMDGLRGLVKRPYGAGLGWNQTQIEMFLVDVRKHVMDGKFHTYFPFYDVYARKPL